MARFGRLHSLTLAFSLLITNGAGAEQVRRARPEPAQSTAVKPAPSKVPRLSDEAELSRAINLKEAGQFHECAEALDRLLNPQSPDRLTDPEIIEQARLYHAHCLIGEGQREAAKEPLRAAIRANPTMKPPDPLVFFPPVVDLFFELMEELDAEIQAQEEKRIAEAERRLLKEKRRRQRRVERLARLKELAEEETVLIQNRRLVAMLPFGAGQFQNGDDALGWTFLTAQVLFGGTALASTFVLLDLRDDAVDRATNPDTFNSYKNTAETVLTISGWSFAAFAAAGILEAQLSFVEQKVEKRRRKLPPDVLAATKQAAKLELRPSVEPTPGGVSFGVVGRF